MKKDTNKVVDQKATGGKILQQLGAHDLSMGGLAKYVGVSRNTVSDWCNGTREPRLMHVVRLMDVLEVDFHELIVVVDP